MARTYGITKYLKFTEIAEIEYYLYIYQCYQVLCLTGKRTNRTAQRQGRYCCILFTHSLYTYSYSSACAGDINGRARQCSSESAARGKRKRQSKRPSPKKCKFHQ